MLASHAPANIYNHIHTPVVSPPMVIYMGEDKFESEFIVTM